MFDARRFLTTEVGKADDVLSLFSSYGMEGPRFETADKWYRRGSIPADWMLQLLCVLELDRGSPVRIAPYLATRKAA